MSRRGVATAPGPEGTVAHEPSNKNEQAKPTALDDQAAFELVELFAVDPEAFAAIAKDEPEVALQFVLNGLAVQLMAQRHELETFASATRVVGAMVNGLMGGGSMAEDAGELLHGFHAAGQRERRRFLKATK